MSPVEACVSEKVIEQLGEMGGRILRLVVLAGKINKLIFFFFESKKIFFNGFLTKIKHG